MTGATWRAALVAALFALHPLHVESVAWVAEQRTYSARSSGCWLGAYVRYVERPGPVWYGLLLASFAVLSLLAKAMLVTLPAVLLLLDYWPLRRFSTSPDALGNAQAGSSGAAPPTANREDSPADVLGKSVRSHDAG